MSRAEQLLRTVLPPDREIRGGTRERWHAIRREGIGASEAAAILGIHPYVSPLAVWAAKTGRAEEPVDSDAAKWGRLLEPVIAREANPKAYRWPQTKSVWIKGAPIFATPDAIAPADEGGAILVECKTTGIRHADKWDESPPPWHLVQVQHALLVTGAKKAILAVLIAGQDYRTYEVERHDTFQERLVERLTDWYERHVVRGVMPDDVRAEDKAVIDALFPTVEQTEPIELPPDLLEIDSELLAIDEQLKQLEKRREELRNRIKLAIGEHAAGRLPDGTIWEWRTIRRKEYVVPAKEFRMLKRKKRRA